MCEANLFTETGSRPLGQRLGRYLHSAWQASQYVPDSPTLPLRNELGRY